MEEQLRLLYNYVILNCEDRMIKSDSPEEEDIQGELEQIWDKMDESTKERARSICAAFNKIEKEMFGEVAPLKSSKPSTEETRRQLWEQSPTTRDLPNTTYD